MSMKSVLKKSCGTLYEYINDVVELDNAFIIRFKGNVDAQTIPCIRFNLEKTEDEYVSKNIIADFKNVERVDTATFAVILEFLGQLKANDNHLFLINVNTHFCNHLKLLNLANKIRVFNSEEEALKELAA